MGRGVSRSGVSGWIWAGARCRSAGFGGRWANAGFLSGVSRRRFFFFFLVGGAAEEGGGRGRRRDGSHHLHHHRRQERRAEAGELFSGSFWFLFFFVYSGMC